MTMVLLLVSGCVRRTIIVETDPPGATVWINEKLVGITPVTHEFITHGRYKFRLEKAGFREQVAREKVRAPIYQWIPLDFVFENLLPVRLEDRHVFRYALSPLPPEERLKEETPATREEILSGLQSPDPQRRRLACAELARLRDPQAAPAVLLATRDPVPAVRATALEAWRAVQGPLALERLIEALRHDPAPEVRWRAASQLEALGSAEAVPALIEALNDRDPLPRAGAAEALKAIADPRAAGPLIRALRDKDTAVRRAAAEGLGRLNDPSAVKPLTRVLFHHDFQTRRRAAQSLRTIKDPAAAPALARTFTNWDPKLRQIATEALIEIGDTRVVPSLVRYLRSWQAVARQHAAMALGGLKDSRAVEPLRRAVAREPNETTRAAMAAALQQLGAVE